MKTFLLFARAAVAAWRLRGALPLALLLLLPWTGRAQAPAWAGATTGSITQGNGLSQTQGTAVDASGNVFVTGLFYGTISFGTTVLSSTGDYDIFVAKYVPGTATWAWAQSAGGIGGDYGYGLAVSTVGGVTSVYVTGSINNNTANDNGVSFGGTSPATRTVAQYGATATASDDIFVAKYTDNGASATFKWAQVGGGTEYDTGNGIAVSTVGSVTSVYITGQFANNRTNTAAALFGGSGATAGTRQQYGASTATGTDSDIVVAKYTDNGATATIGWTQVAGGLGYDIGNAIAASGSSVYVTGYLDNNRANTNAVRFGGAGTTAGTRQQYGASTTAGADVFVARYADAGTSAAVSWQQVAGGSDSDIGNGIAVNGSAVYVTGFVYNDRANTNAVVFGGAGTTAGTRQQYGASTTSSPDIFLARYTDNGTTATVAWTQVAGGDGNDQGLAVAVSGTGVFVTGIITNDAANTSGVLFGGTGITAGTRAQAGATSSASNDVLVAKYTDNTTSATSNWSQVGGGSDYELSSGIAVSGTSVYTVGYLYPGGPITFGTATGSPVAGTLDRRASLEQLTDNGTSGSWQAVAASANGGVSETHATAVDASGNVFVTGYFTGTVTFGTTVLGSLGDYDMFVAKYVPGTDTWAWAQSGGGLSTDQGLGIGVSTVSGVTSVYVTGFLTNDRANTSAVLLGATGTTAGTRQQYGASSGSSRDIFVAKYTDNGTTATLGWTQVAGGISDDQGYALVVSGSSVYITGSLENDQANTASVFFGGAGTTAGTRRQNGASTGASRDIFVAKYTDNGATATVTWTQVGGGTSSDLGQGLALSGTSLYVAGNLVNNQANANGVLFGGTGTTVGTRRQNGATSSNTLDLVLAKYTDNGSTATLGWTQVAGGTGYDQGFAVAVSGTSVYLTGYLTNDLSNSSGVLFGATGTTAGTRQQYGASTSNSADLVLAKYTDNGTTATLGWTQVAGGTDGDFGSSLVVKGRSVFVAGSVVNDMYDGNQVVFGGSGTTAGTTARPGVYDYGTSDLMLAKYTDNGATATVAWTQLGGGAGADFALGLVASGSTLYVAGTVVPAATFGSLSINTPLVPGGVTTNFLGKLLNAVPLPVQLTAFTATAQGPTAAQLTWATASEKNSAYFALERSPDGTAWHELARVAAAGHSSTPRTYAHPDAQRPTGLSYYRLRQVDLDGTFAYSPVRTVAGMDDGTAPALTLFPNPAHGMATLRGAAPGTRVQVLDALGRPVAQATADASGTAQLTLPTGLAPGVYVVRSGTLVQRLAVE